MMMIIVMEVSKMIMEMMVKMKINLKSLEKQWTVKTKELSSILSKNLYFNNKIMYQELI
jgi:hypothetical protein